jgi:YfiH family protein
MSADCLPIVLARSGEDAPAVAVLHAGWKGLLAGIVQAGAHALGGGALRAAIGPAIGPCCYEVGEEVAAPYRERFGDDVVRGRHLDLWTSAERALRAAGIEQVDRFDRCTACEPETFFSHRRDAGRTGRQGVIAYVTG